MVDPEFSETFPERIVTRDAGWKALNAEISIK